MNELQVFENKQFGQVRTIEQDGQTWFVLKDVCASFGETNYRRVSARLDEDEKGVSQIDTPGGEQTMTVINESGLYAALFAMQPEKARGVDDTYIEERMQKLRAFKRWITHEVIPSIRRHGAYATDSTIDQIISNPDFGIKLLGQLKQERDARRLLEEQARADAPKVRFAEAVEQSKNDILIGEMAQILAQNGMETGEKRLFETLRRDGYLKRSRGDEWNMPTQRSIELGVMRIVKRTVILPSGREEIRRTTKITGKGQVYFLKRYTEQGDAQAN